MINPETRSDEQAVLEASQAFYAAIQALDTERMERLWLQDERSRCVHPGWDVLEGWEEIRQSWANIFRNTKRMQVRVSQLSVQVVGEPGLGLLWSRTLPMPPREASGRPWWGRRTFSCG